VGSEDGGVAARRIARGRGPRRYKRTSTELEFTRFAGLSDGVFAIAMTLLVVTVGEPTVSAARISSELKDLLPQISAFFLSFAVIGRYWLAHHEFVSVLTEVNGRLLASNLLYLAVVAFLPFTTGLLGDYNAVPLIVAVYALNVAAISSMEVVMFVIAHRGGMVERPLPGDVYRYAILESMVPVVVFLVSIPLAFLHHYAAYACWASLLILEPVAARRRPADADPYLP
jgi:uncharacterized membrane protein